MKRITRAFQNKVAEIKGVIENEVDNTKIKAESYARIGGGTAIGTAGIATVILAPTVLGTVAAGVATSYALDKVYHNEGFKNRLRNHSEKNIKSKPL